MFLPSMLGLRKLLPLVIRDVEQLYREGTILQLIALETAARDNKVVFVSLVGANTMIQPWIAHIWLSNAFEVFIVINDKLCALVRLLIPA